MGMLSEEDKVALADITKAFIKYATVILSVMILVTLFLNITIGSAYISG